MSKLLLLAIFTFSFCLRPHFLRAQDFNPGDYVTGMTIVGKLGADSSCPPVVWVVTPDTPAAKAGIRPGDRVRAIDGHYGPDIVQAQSLLHTKAPTPSTIELEGRDGVYAVTVGRIKASDLYEKQGWKVGPDGGLYAKDATEAEMQRITNINSGPTEKVFGPAHYPANLDLYYPGFEVFVWRESQTLTIGGIEEGPAKMAGVHYGDLIVSVNGVNPRGKSVVELEKLFSSPKPSTLTLVIDRDGTRKTFTFEMAKASEIAEANHKQLYKGRMIPSVIPEAYLHCFDPRPVPGR